MADVNPGTAPAPSNPAPNPTGNPTPNPTGNDPGSQPTLNDILGKLPEEFRGHEDPIGEFVKSYNYHKSEASRARRGHNSPDPEPKGTVVERNEFFKKMREQFEAEGKISDDFRKKAYDYQYSDAELDAFAQVWQKQDNDLLSELGKHTSEDINLLWKKAHLYVPEDKLDTIKSMINAGFHAEAAEKLESYWKNTSPVERGTIIGRTAGNGFNNKEDHDRMLREWGKGNEAHDDLYMTKLNSTPKHIREQLGI